MNPTNSVNYFNFKPFGVFENIRTVLRKTLIIDLHIINIDKKNFTNIFSMIFQEQIIDYDIIKNCNVRIFHNITYIECFYVMFYKNKCKINMKIKDRLENKK